MITIDTLFLGAAIHGVALVLLLVLNGFANRKANLLLAGLVGLLTITMWNVFVQKTGGEFHRFLIDYYLWVTPLLWAPVLYLYVGQLSHLRDVTIRRLFLHALPAILAGLAQIPIHLYSDTQSGALFYGYVHKSIVALIYVQIAAYFLLSLRLLRTYRAKAMETRSALDKINLNWLTIVVVLFSVILAADFALNIPAIFFGVTRPEFYDAVLLAEACSVFAIGYLSLRQPEILLGHSLAPQPVVSGASTKYLGSPVDEQLGAELADKLDRVMETKQVFLQNDLKLAELADIAGLSPHHLSQVINQHHHKNFYDYVNGYRAKFAADHLRKHGKTNLTRLAFDAGFNNRVSFSKAFRKHTGQTPTDFLERLKQSDVA